MNYEQLVKALRCCKLHIPCEKCPKYKSTGSLCVSDLHDDAADAIEELQQIADHYEQTAKDYWKEACECKAQLPKLGEWIIVDEWKNTLGDKLMKIKCPFCNQQIKLYEQPMPKYCDSCGAKMEVQE